VRARSRGERPATANPVRHRPFLLVTCLPASCPPRIYHAATLQRSAPSSAAAGAVVAAVVVAAAVGARPRPEGGRRPSRPARRPCFPSLEP
jgi:hypothetical protein